MGTAHTHTLATLLRFSHFLGLCHVLPKPTSFSPEKLPRLRWVEKLSEARSKKGKSDKSSGLTFRTSNAAQVQGRGDMHLGNA